MILSNRNDGNGRVFCINKFLLYIGKIKEENLNNKETFILSSKR